MEVSSDNWFFYKHLKLVSPEEANRLGVFAECPVFISPYAETNYCQICDVKYSPLVYQAGYTIEAQHYHPNEKIGGIYLFSEIKNPYLSTSSVLESESVYNAFGWFGILKPEFTIYSSMTCTSSKVYVEQIKAFCKGSKIDLDLDCGKGLKEGIIQQPANLSYLGNSAHDLVPLCSSGCVLSPSINTEFKFTVTPEGAVSFNLN